MPELFNPEQYHQQMNGQAAQMPQDPYQGQPQGQQPAAQPYQPQHAQYAQMQQPQMQPNPYQPQEWAPQHQPMQHQAMQPPPMMQPQTPMHHMPVAPVFAPPPGTAEEEIEEAPKTSRFKKKRALKIKTPKAKKSKDEAAESVHTTKTSPAMIFMFGMATGIVCFLAGNMAMSSLLADNSAKSFREIERQNAAARQPVLPQPVEKSAQNTEG